MKAPIKRRDMVRAAREFALPQIKIVQPRFAVCFGKEVFNALAVVVGLPGAGSLAEAVDSPFPLDATTTVWCQAHPGVMGANNRVGWTIEDPD